MYFSINASAKKKMKTIESMLKKEMYHLEKIIKGCEKRLGNAPEGKLRIARKKNRFEYYYVNGTDNSNKYLKKKEESLARRIVQRDYDTDISKFAKERLRIIEKFLLNYKKISLSNVNSKVNVYRKELIDSLVMTDEEFVRAWESVKYETKEFSDSIQAIITERGECVRSKSEKIIADKLYMLGIPYRYECPIVLDGNLKIYPDFTILKMPEREEVYLEHFGMLDDDDYVHTAIHKLNTYERNGIYLGVKLFLTYETSKKPLNVKAVGEMIRELWVEETIKKEKIFNL